MLEKAREEGQRTNQRWERLKGAQRTWEDDKTFIPWLGGSYGRVYICQNYTLKGSFFTMYEYDLKLFQLKKKTQNKNLSHDGYVGLHFTIQCIYIYRMLEIFQY